MSSTDHYVDRLASVNQALLSTFDDHFSKFQKSIVDRTFLLENKDRDKALMCCLWAWNCRWTKKFGELCDEVVNTLKTQSEVLGHAKNSGVLNLDPILTQCKKLPGVILALNNDLKVLDTKPYKFEIILAFPTTVQEHISGSDTALAKVEFFDNPHLHHIKSDKCKDLFKYLRTIV